MKKNTKYILGLTVALVLPLALYFFVIKNVKPPIKIPNYYRIDKVDTITKNGKTIIDTIYHKVAEIKVINQMGDSVYLNKDLQGKLLVVDFFYTQCKSICPRLSAAMQMLQKAYNKKNPNIVQFISISVDPQHDSANVLRQYANRYTQEHDRWWFVTANQNEVFNYAKNELGLILNNADEPGEFVHSNKLILIDTKRNIRGYFDANDNMALRRLADDIVIIAAEQASADAVFNKF